MSFFENNKEIDNLLAKITNKNKKKTQITKIGNERWTLLTTLQKLNKIILFYYEY